MTEDKKKGGTDWDTEQQDPIADIKRAMKIPHVIRPTIYIMTEAQLKYWKRVLRDMMKEDGG